MFHASVQKRLGYVIILNRKYTIGSNLQPLKCMSANVEVIILSQAEVTSLKY
jgi:hypothetical protein